MHTDFHHCGGQLYIDGEFIGGCDIVIDMYQAGELQELIETVQNS